MGRRLLKGMWNSGIWKKNPTNNGETKLSACIKIKREHELLIKLEGEDFKKVTMRNVLFFGKKVINKLQKIKK